jgi:hypothetical protein
LREHFKPVQPGEHDVEKDEIKPPVECTRQAGCTIMDSLDRVVRLGEEFANQLAQAHVIINNQDVASSVILILHAASSFITLPRALIGQHRNLNNS